MGDIGENSGGPWEFAAGPPRSPVGPLRVLWLIAGGFAVVGGVILSEYPGELGRIDLLFNAFMYVGLPVAVVVLSGLYLRGSELPRSALWNVVAGYLAGLAFIAVLILWDSATVLRESLPLWQLLDAFVFFGNLGGLFGFVAGVSRAQSVYNRQLRTELERQNERLDEFASFIAHDVRNPVMVAKGRIDLLETEVENEHTSAIRSALDRIEELIEDVLTLARQSDHLDSLEPVDLGAVARSGWENVETDVATLEVAAETRIAADEQRLKQIFENLFRNAVEHGTTGGRPGTDDGGEGAGPDVSVTVGDLPDGFYVADDGPGIPADEREAVFEAGVSSAEHGTGFGLRIVQVIAKAHGWDVSVTEGADGGARFEFTGVESADR